MTDFVTTSDSNQKKSTENKENKYVVVSIYINPTQFNDDKDLEKYPVDLTKDQKLLSPYSNQIIIYSPEQKDL